MKKRISRAFTLVELVVVIAVISILLVILVPNFLRAQAQSQLVSCRANLRDVAVAVELYSMDNKGHFPPARSFTSAIVGPGKYLPAIPLCPSVKIDTYSPSYELNRNPDKYTLYCSGLNHQAAGINRSNYPQFTSGSDLRVVTGD